MVVLRWVIFAVIVVGVLTFALQNQEQTVSVQMMGWQSTELPLYLALFFAFVLGMIAFLVISAYTQLSTQSQLSREKKKTKKLNDDIEEKGKKIAELEELLKQRTAFSAPVQPSSSSNPSKEE